MKKTGFLLLALCFCMLLPLLVACGGKPNDDVTPDGKFVYDDLTRETAADSIPEGYDLGAQTITIAHTYTSTGEEALIGNKESTDIVYSKIHERNLLVQERLNVNFDYFKLDGTNWTSYGETIRRDVQTMSAAWELLFTLNNAVVATNSYNYFHNLNDSNYIDIEERWWATDAIMELAVDNYNYRFLYGDISINCFAWAGAVYYNKDLYDQYVTPGNPDELYTKVLDGKWTFEEFTRLVKKGKIEKGGDGSNDIYGFVPVNGQEIHWLQNGVGLTGYERDDYGMPIFNLAGNDKAVDFMNALYELYFENEGTLSWWPKRGTDPDSKAMFTNGRSLFFLRGLNTLMDAEMREMKSDFGILPYPKWDEEQDTYISFIHNSSAVVCIPVSTDIDRTNEELSAVIEALASESYRRVYTAYYESALKTAYNRDDYSAQMVDIITGQHATVKSVLTKNFVYEYSLSMQDIGGIYYGIIKKNSNNFVSEYDALLPPAKTGLKKLIDDYKSGKI
ncbi:MAG: hypothetical protein E7634_06510 [Ruminococcaceae bacterium]|nr:hypothetical protein [Oscillospiraceae bacterium]